MNDSRVTREGSLLGSSRGWRSIKARVMCAAIIATAALLAGCGSSGTTTTTTTHQSASSGASNTQSKAVSFADTANCKSLDGVGTKFAQAMQAATKGGNTNYQAAEKAYQQLADSAPSAIRPALETLAGAFTNFANAISKSGYTAGKTPSGTQLLALESAAKSFASSKLTHAEKQVEAWAVRNCS